MTRAGGEKSIKGPDDGIPPTRLSTHKTHREEHAVFDSVAIHTFFTYLLSFTHTQTSTSSSNRWLGGLLVERRTSVSQIRGSIQRIGDIGNFTHE